MTAFPAETTPCLSCGGRLATVLDRVTDTRFGIDKVYRIARCGACGLEQTLPRPEPAELGAFYARHYNFGGESGTAYTRLRRRFLESPLYRIWMALDGDISFHGRPAPATGQDGGHRGGQGGAPGGRLLDIGCNEGRGLSLYARNGFASVEGLETNPVAAAAARNRGFTVHETEIEAFRPAERYDVAVLSNVLEHALDPAAMLAEVARILRPGGEVWISCPNARSWARRLFGRSWINWHVPFHIVHFDDATLSATLAKAGFALRQRDQATPALWITHSLLAALFATPGLPTRALRRAPLVMAGIAGIRGLLFPLLWLGNRLGRGDCLLAIARLPAAEQP